MNGYVYGGINGCTDGWIDEEVNRWMGGWRLDAWINERMYGWIMDEQMVELMEGRVNRWMNR